MRPGAFDIADRYRGWWRTRHPRRWPWFVLGFGLGFQIPIVVVLLGLLGIVSVPTMASVRRYVLLVIVTVAAVVTPPDVTSQILLAIPMYLLYEGGLLAARMVVRRRAEERRQAEGG